MKSFFYTLKAPQIYNSQVYEEMDLISAEEECNRERMQHDDGAQ